MAISPTLTSQSDFQQVFQALGGSPEELASVTTAENPVSEPIALPIANNTPVNDTLSITSLPFPAPGFPPGTPMNGQNPMLALMGQMLQMMMLMMTHMMGQGGFYTPPEPPPQPAPLTPYGYSMSYGANNTPASSPLSDTPLNNTSNLGANLPQASAPVSSPEFTEDGRFIPKILRGELPQRVQSQEELRAVLGR
ncbi:MAG: hypothetical protein VKJ04_00055 [Vampirovibrionales bacterium]|nr:hypothetical protein [Vampirovibrionales bacterium]